MMGRLADRRWLVSLAAAITALLVLTADGGAKNLARHAGALSRAPRSAHRIVQRQASRPLRDALTAGGRLRPHARGSFNAHGYRMVLARNGAPRFVPAAAPAAGDNAWSDAFGVVGAPNGSTINAVAVSGQNIYVGGYFSNLSYDAGLPLNNVAMYNGRGWYPLGTSASNGVNGEVYALAVSGTKVYVGGSFNSASGVAANAIAAWNGTTWSGMAGGVSDPVSGNTPSVDALAVTTSGVLYAAGQFEHAGSVSANSIAAWNGTGWSALGTGIQNCTYFDTANHCYSSPSAGQVKALAVSGSTLYVGGSFNLAGGAVIGALASWNGSAWSPVGGAPSNNGSIGTVDALALNGTTLYVGGTFDHVGSTVDATGAVTAAGPSAASVASWSPAGWSALGSGATNCSGCGSATVSTLAYWNGRLYMSGNFYGAGGDGQNNTAQWDGASWAPIGPNLSGAPYALLSTPSGVIAAGGFGTTADNTVQLNNLGLWNGQRWSGYGLGVSYSTNAGSVGVVAASNHAVYAGGNFYVAGSTPAHNLAMFDGTSWHPVGGGIGSGSPYAILISGSNVYVAGSFTQAGTVAASNIARWDGTAWHQLGTGVNGTVQALAMYNGMLWVGGSFSVAGGTSASDVATWNPTTSTWSAVGGNLHYDGSVDSLAGVPSPYNHYMAIGGNFAQVDTGGSTPAYTTVNSVVLYDTHNTTTTDPTAGYQYLPGSGTNGPGVWTNGTYGPYAGTAQALAVVGTELYVGGSFTSSGFGASNGFVAYDLNGGVWSSPGTVGGGSSGGTVSTITQVGGALYLGGDFTTAGTVLANDVARFVPSPTTPTWSTLGSGVADGPSGFGSSVSSLAESADGLYVGGGFALTGGKAAENIGLWMGTQFPLHVTQTVSPGTVAANANVTFTAKVTNNATTSAGAVTLAATLPANATFVSATPSQGSACTRSGRALSCALGTVAAGASATVAIVVQPIQPPSATDVVAVSESGSTNTGTATTTAVVTPKPGYSYLAVSDSGFSSRTLVAALGTTVQFDFLGPAAHSVAEPTSGCSTGSHAAISIATCAFTASGNFTAEEDGATTHETTIEVPDALSVSTIVHGHAMTITTASAAPPSGSGIDLQVLRPGATTWTALATGSSATTTSYSPATAGTYEFRSRLRNLTTNVASGFSVPQLLFVS